MRDECFYCMWCSCFNFLSLDFMIFSNLKLSLHNCVFYLIGNCPAGTKIDGSECKPCPVKTFQDEPRQTECKPCAPNHSTDGEGKTSPDDCQSKSDIQSHDLMKGISYPKSLV